MEDKKLFFRFSKIRNNRLLHRVQMVKYISYTIIKGSWCLSQWKKGNKRTN